MAARVELIQAREHHTLAPAIRELKALSRLNFLVNAALQSESPDDDVDDEILYDLAKGLEYLGLQIEQLHQKKPAARRPKARRAPAAAPLTSANVVALPPRAGA